MEGQNCFVYSVDNEGI